MNGALFYAKRFMEKKTNMSSEQKLKIMLYSLEEYDRKQYERYRDSSR